MGLLYFMTLLLCHQIRNVGINILQETFIRKFLKRYQSTARFWSSRIDILANQLPQSKYHCYNKFLSLVHNHMADVTFTFQLLIVFLEHLVKPLYLENCLKAATSVRGQITKSWVVQTFHKSSWTLRMTYYGNYTSKINII